MSAVQESHGTVPPKKKKKTQKPKNKQGGGGGAENSQGTQIKTTSNREQGILRTMLVLENSKKLRH
jgi:hypothetical protein